MRITVSRPQVCVKEVQHEEKERPSLVPVYPISRPRRQVFPLENMRRRRAWSLAAGFLVRSRFRREAATGTGCGLSYCPIGWLVTSASAPSA